MEGLEPSYLIPSLGYALPTELIKYFNLLKNTFLKLTIQNYIFLFNLKNRSYKKLKFLKFFNPRNFNVSLFRWVLPHISCIIIGSR